MLFQKFQNRKQNIKDAGVVGWGWPIFSKFRKNKGCHQSCQQLSILMEKCGKFCHSDVFISYAWWTGEIFFYPNGYGEMQRTSYHEDLSQEAPFWPSLSPEQRTTESHLSLSYIRSSPVSASNSSESQGSPCTSYSDDSPDAISASRTKQQGKKFYEKWSKKEKKLLVQLWADIFDSLESKDAQKV